jgi:hypothetical protein
VQAPADAGPGGRARNEQPLHAGFRRRCFDEGDMSTQRAGFVLSDPGLKEMVRAEPAFGVFRLVDGVVLGQMRITEDLDTATEVVDPAFAKGPHRTHRCTQPCEAAAPFVLRIL